MGHGGARKGAGFPSGKLKRKTIEKQAEREIIFSFVSERLTGILEAMHSKAIGSDDIPPDEKAAKLLLEYAYGKPQQYVDITSGGEQVALTAQDLIERIKNAKAGKK